MINLAGAELPRRSTRREFVLMKSKSCGIAVSRSGPWDLVAVQVLAGVPGIEFCGVWRSSHAKKDRARDRQGERENENREEVCRRRHPRSLLSLTTIPVIETFR